MNGLRDALPQYVALRRALGTKLQEPARTLEHLLDFLEREGSEFITSELALRWAMERCFAVAWISVSLLFGWAMNRLKQPRSTSTPICNSKRKRWRTPHRQAQCRTVSGQQTRCSPSWRVCDYAASRNHASLRSLQIGASARSPRGIIRESA